MIAHPKTRSGALALSADKLWLLAPAVAALVGQLLEPKWQLLYVGAVFIVVPIALVIRDAKLWLFLICALSAFNFVKVIGGNPLSEVEDATLLTVGAVDVPLAVLLTILFARATGGSVPMGSIGAGGRRALLLCGLFCAWALGGAVVAPRANVSLIQAAGYVRLLLILVVTAYCVSDPERLKWGLAGLFLALGAQSLIAIAQFLAGSSFGLYQHFEEDSAAGMLTRSGGTLNPTVLSEYIGLLAPVVLALAFAVRRNWLCVALLALFGSAGVASTLTLSRAGLLSIGLTTFLVVTWGSLRKDMARPRKLALVSGTMAMFLVTAVAFSGSVVARVTESAYELEGEAGRLPQMKQAIAMISHRPLMGVGLGNYVEQMGGYGPTLPYPVHNKLLLVTAETGIPGGVLYLALWMFALAFFVKQASRGTLIEGAFYVGGAAAILGTLLNMNTDVYSTGGAPELGLFLLTGMGIGFAARRDAT
jgi:O-antigen ligase